MGGVGDIMQVLGSVWELERPIDHGTGSDDDRGSKLDETSANRRELGQNRLRVFFSFYSLYLPETCRLSVCYFHLVFSVPHLLVPLTGNRQDHDPYGYQLGRCCVSSFS
jgi:hypothetical protein